MKRKTIVFIIFLLINVFIIGCNHSSPNGAKRVKTVSKHAITIEALGHGLRRFENNEIICYYEYDGSMECKWKQ